MNKQLVSVLLEASKAKAKGRIYLATHARAALRGDDASVLASRRHRRRRRIPGRVGDGGKTARIEM